MLVGLAGARRDLRGSQLEIYNTRGNTCFIPFRQMAALAAVLLQSHEDFPVAQAVAHRYTQDSEVARSVVQGASAHHPVSIHLSCNASSLNSFEYITAGATKVSPKESASQSCTTT